MTAVATALALAASSALAISPASAQYHGRHGGYHHRYHGGGGAFAGFAAGALLGGVLAAQRPYYYSPGYVYGGDAVGYCASRFRSYDPASGTYLGYDGYRHPCP
jgi:hypothetical protein